MASAAPASMTTSSSRPDTSHAAAADAADAADAVPTPEWGVLDAAGGWLIAQVTAVIGGAIVVSVAGYASRPDDIPLTLIAVLQPFLWVGFFGAPVLAARLKGNSVMSDFGLRIRALDVPVGIAIGVGCQFVLVPAVSLPWAALLDRSTDELSAPAQELADKATDPLGVVLLVLIVVLGAPIVEELFFRGLLQRSIVRRFSPGIGVAVTALVFGVSHWEVLQFPALVAFGAVLGVMAVRTGRLGPSIVAHLAFNAVTVAALLTTS